MYIHRLRKTTLGNGGSMTKKIMVKGKIAAKPMMRQLGSGIKAEVYDTQMGVVKPTDVLRNIKVAKSRIPKKYITFD